MKESLTIKEIEFFLFKIKNILTFLSENYTNNSNKVLIFNNCSDLNDLINRINNLNKKFLPILPCKNKLSFDEHLEKVFIVLIMFFLKIYFCHENKFINFGKNKIDCDNLYHLSDFRFIISIFSEKINFYEFLKNKRFLNYIRKEILPFFYIIFSKINCETIISIVKCESPDFIVCTNKKIYAYEFSSLNTKNQILNLENCENKFIDIEKLFINILKKVSNLEKYKKKLDNLFGKNNYKFQIIFSDILYENNEDKIIKLKIDLDEYVKQNKNKLALLLNLNEKYFDLITNFIDDTLEFVYWDAKN